MELLIYFYDNLLIYYPNIFFIITFLLFISLIFLTIKIIRVILREGIKGFGKIRLQPIRISNFPLAVVLKFIEKICKLLRYLQIKIEMILKKIGKEIFIDE